MQSNDRSLAGDPQFHPTRLDRRLVAAGGEPRNPACRLVCLTIIARLRPLRADTRVHPTRNSTRNIEPRCIFGPDSIHTAKLRATPRRSLRVAGRVSQSSSCPVLLVLLLLRRLFVSVRWLAEAPDVAKYNRVPRRRVRSRGGTASLERGAIRDRKIFADIATRVAGDFEFLRLF